MTQPRTANFWEALKSAAANPGEMWRRVSQTSPVYCFRFGNHDLLYDLNGDCFRVEMEDVTATWTCET